MTSKNSFCDLAQLRGRMKRGAWLPGLMACALFFILPVATALSISNFTPRDIYLERGYTAQRIADIYASSLDFLINAIGLAAMFLSIFAGILCALIAWNYLNSRRQIDLYHSLPRTRRTLFGSFYSYGALSFLLPYFIMLALSVLVIALTGYIGMLDWIHLGRMAGITVLLFLSCFSLSTLACHLCGHILVSLCGCITFLSFFPALIFLVQYSFYRFFDTYYQISERTEQLYRFTSPIVDLLAYGGFNEQKVHWLWWVFVIVALTALSLLCYQRRPSEAAARALAFRASRPFIKYPIMLVVTMVFGFFFEGLGGNDFWMVFGFAAGIVCCHAVLEVIFDFDLRAALKGVRGLGIYTVCFALFMCAVYFDWIGFDSRLPQRDRLSSVSIRISDFSELYYDVTPKSDRYQTDMLSTLRFDDAQMLDLATAIAENGVKNLDDVSSSRYYTNVVLTFHQGSTSFTRQYRVFDSEIKDLLKAVFDNEAFQKKFYFVYSIDPDTFDRVTVTDHYRYYSPYNDTSKNKTLIKELITALQNDIPTMTAQQLVQQDYLFTMEFFDENNGNAYVIPIYERYTQTLSAMQRHNLNIPPVVQPEEIESISFTVDAYTLAEKVTTIDIPDLTLEQLREAAQIVNIDKYTQGGYDKELYDYPYDTYYEDPHLNTEYHGEEVYSSTYAQPVTPSATTPNTRDYYSYTVRIEDKQVISSLLPYLYNGMRSWYNPFFEAQDSLAIYLTSAMEYSFEYPEFYFAANRVPSVLYDFVKTTIPVSHPVS